MVVPRDDSRYLMTFDASAIVAASVLGIRELVCHVYKSPFAHEPAGAIRQKLRFEEIILIFYGNGRYKGYEDELKTVFA